MGPIATPSITFDPLNSNSVEQIATDFPSSPRTRASTHTCARVLSFPPERTEVHHHPPPPPIDFDELMHRRDPIDRQTEGGRCSMIVQINRVVRIDFSRAKQSRRVVDKNSRKIDVLSRQTRRKAIIKS